MEKEKGLGNFSGHMESIIQDNGPTERKMATDIGLRIKAKPTWDNGEMAK